MKKIYFLLMIVLATSAGSSAQQAPDHIDPTVVAPDKYKVLLENEYVRVVEYLIKPGETDPWHTHPPKVSYIVSAGILRITLESGDSFEVTEESDNATWLGAIGRHYGENIGTTPVRIVLVEIKSLADAPFETPGKPE